MTNAEPITAGWNDVLEVALISQIDATPIVDSMQRGESWEQGFKLYRRLVASGSRVPLALAASC